MEHDHGVPDGAGGEEVDEQPDALHRDLRLRLFGARAEVRRDQHPRHAEQRAVGAGLLLEHVERHAPDQAPLQPLDEGRLVVDSAAGAVDEPHAGLEDLEFLHAHEVPRLVGERRVHREVVDVGQHAADALHQLDAELRGAVRRQEGVVAEHPHVEGPGAFGHRLADAAEPHDAERLAGELRAHELVAIPLLGSQARVGRGHVPRQAEHQREGMLRRAQRVAGRRVHHHDAEAGGRLLVDVVGAHAGPHDRPQAMVAGERVGGDLHPAAADGAVVLREGVPQVVSLEAGLHLVGDALRLRGLQQGEAVRAERVEHDDRGHGAAIRWREAAGQSWCSRWKSVMKSRSASTPATGIAL
jgi:hypothetical protein